MSPSRTTSFRLQQRLRLSHTVRHRPRSGRPRITTQRQARFLVRNQMKNRFLTAAASSSSSSPAFYGRRYWPSNFPFQQNNCLGISHTLFFFLPKACLEEAAAVRNLLFIWFLTRNLACLWVVILGLPDRGRCLTVCERRRRCWSLKLVVLLELILSEIGKLDSKEQRAKYRPFSL